MSKNIEIKARELALLNLIFQCNLDSIYNLVTKIESDFIRDYHESIKKDNHINLNKEMNIELFTIVSQEKYTAISFYILVFSCLENHINRVKNLLDIKERKLIKILKLLKGTYPSLNENNLNWEKIHLLNKIRNQIIHHNESFDIKILDAFNKIYKNNLVSLNTTNQIEIEFNFIKIFIEDLYIIFLSKSIKLGN